MVQSKHQFHMSQSQLYIAQLHKQLHQVVVVKNAELTVQHHTLQLRTTTICSTLLRKVFDDRTLA